MPAMSRAALHVPWQGPKDQAVRQGSLKNVSAETCRIGRRQPGEGPEQEHREERGSLQTEWHTKWGRHGVGDMGSPPGGAPAGQPGGSMSVVTEQKRVLCSERTHHHASLHLSSPYSQKRIFWALIYSFALVSYLWLWHKGQTLGLRH